MIFPFFKFLPKNYISENIFTSSIHIQVSYDLISLGWFLDKLTEGLVYTHQCAHFGNTFVLKATFFYKYNVWSPLVIFHYNSLFISSDPLEAVIISIYSATLSLDSWLTRIQESILIVWKMCIEVVPTNIILDLHLK